MSRRERIIQRNRTERLSELLDWSRLGQVCWTLLYVEVARSRNAIMLQICFPRQLLYMLCIAMYSHIVDLSL